MTNLSYTTEEIHLLYLILRASDEACPYSLQRLFYGYYGTDATTDYQWIDYLGLQDDDALFRDRLSEPFKLDVQLVFGGAPANVGWRYVSYRRIRSDLYESAIEKVPPLLGEPLRRYGACR